MKKIFFSCLMISLHFFVRAQDEKCDATTIMNVKGNWKKVADANMKPDKNLAQITSRIDAISKLYQEAYNDPKGMQAEWYRTMEGEQIVKNGPTTYRFNSLYLSWYCNQNLHKLMLGDETGTWSYVYMNDFGWFMTRQYDMAGLTIENADAWVLPKKIGDWKGLPLYEPTGGPAGKQKVVLITRDNQLPYKPVSRLQFLQALKQKIETDKKTQLDAQQKIVVRSDAEEEAAKQKGLLDIEKTVASRYWEQRKAGYLKNYKTDAQRKQENIQIAEKYFNDKLKPLNDELSNESSNELQQPAIVGNDFTSVFKGFSTDEKGGRMIVLKNAAYFNLQLPRYVPQMIVLYWSWDKNSSAQLFKEQLEANFPIDKLKAMIDK